MNILYQTMDKRTFTRLLTGKLKTRRNGINTCEIFSNIKKNNNMERKDVIKFEKKLKNKGAQKRKEVIRLASLPIIILITIMSFTAHSQPILQLGAGFTSQNKMAAELSAGYNTRPVFFQVGYIASVTRDVDAGTYLNARIGHRFERGEYVFEPSFGYAYVLKSTDRKYLNQNEMIYSFYAGKVINSGTLLLGVNYSERVILGLLTIRYNF